MRSLLLAALLAVGCGGTATVPSVADAGLVPDAAAGSRGADGATGPPDADAAARLPDEDASAADAGADACPAGETLCLECSSGVIECHVPPCTGAPPCPAQ